VEYLNNRATLGFKSMKAACATIKGFEFFRYLDVSTLTSQQRTGFQAERAWLRATAIHQRFASCSDYCYEHSGSYPRSGRNTAGTVPILLADVNRSERIPSEK
jgi:hypothetical protein